MVDCQADLLEDLATRFMAPLLPESEFPQPMTRLTPRFEIAGQKLIMATTHLASAVPDKAIGKQFASLVHEQDVVANAIDMLICSF